VLDPGGEISTPRGWTRSTRPPERAQTRRVGRTVANVLERLAEVRHLGVVVDELVICAELTHACVRGCVQGSDSFENKLVLDTGQ
jgi:Xaa-Pro aminopeptidase